ncbi:MAG TPA: hypothetical protein VFN13_07875, partial [Rudaea sp.]|nr:hypothetical protein [Rudaea sp.]
IEGGYRNGSSRGLPIAVKVIGIPVMQKGTVSSQARMVALAANSVPAAAHCAHGCRNPRRTRRRRITARLAVGRTRKFENEAYADQRNSA